MTGNEKLLLHSAQVAQQGSHNWLYNFYILWISLPGHTCKILHRADFVSLCTGACACDQHYTHTLSVAGRKMPGTVLSISMVNYQNRSGWSFPSVAHHVSSASGQAAAGVGQRADATIRFPWQQRRGVRPEMLQTPLLLSAAQHTVLQKTVLF